MIKIHSIEPSSHLEKRICVRIAREEKRSAALWLTAAASCAAASTFGIVAALTSLYASFRESGVYEYLSLLASDSSFIFGMWKEFSMSLAESLPFLGMAALLACAGALIWSVSKMPRNARRVFAA